MNTVTSGALEVSPPNGNVDITQGPQSAWFQMASGTFVANGASVVTVADANVSATSMVIVTLKAPGGTVGAIPVVQTITAGTGFTVAGTASDTSTYNYLLIG